MESGTPTEGRWDHGHRGQAAAPPVRMGNPTDNLIDNPVTLPEFPLPRGFEVDSERSLRVLDGARQSWVLCGVGPPCPNRRSLDVDRQLKRDLPQTVPAHLVRFNNKY